MSNQRKDMWKLLYNHVNRNGANLAQVYTVIEDILCQEPSLISCSLVRELNNKFQDTFLLWLLNKLARCLSEAGDGSQCINLQRKILSSCCSNHPKLYERLVLAYIEALQELHLQLSGLDFRRDHSQSLCLGIFKCDVACLQEFDPHCAFEDIQLPVEKADSYAKSLLTVLQHAHLIGHATHAGIFSGSLRQALHILKECDLEAKLASLGYCHSVLQSQSAHSWQTDPDVAHYAQLTLEALTIMWSMVSKWLEMGCATRQEVKQLTVATGQLLRVLQLHLRSQQALQLGYLLVNELLSLTASVELEELLEGVSNYIQGLLEHASPSLEQLEHLQQLVLSHWRSHPAHLLPLLALLALKHPGTRTATVEALIREGLVPIMQKKEALTADELRLMVALLRALKQLEQLTLAQSQLKIAEQEGSRLSANVLAKMPLQGELPRATDINWNNLAMQLVDQQSRCNAYLEICSLLMQVSSIRHALKSPTQHQLLSILQSRLELGQLCAIRLETTPSSAHTQLQSFYAQHHVSLFREQGFYDHIPQLYIAGYLKPEQLLKALPTIESPKRRHQVLRLLLCSSQFAFKVRDSIELYCPKCRPLPEKLPAGIYLGRCKQPAAKLDFSGPTLELIARDLLFQPDFSFISRHLDMLGMQPKMILRLLNQEPRALKVLNANSFRLLVPALCAVSADFMQHLASFVLGSIKALLAKPLAEQNVASQRNMLRIVIASAGHAEIEEIWLFHWFKMTFFFLVHTHSLVGQEAVLAASEMCARHGVQTINLWNWYRRDALDLVIRLALAAYLTDGVRFTRSLRALSKMLGFSCVQEFTCKYHRFLTAMVLPHCIMEPRCKGVLVLIAKQLRKPIATLFSTSFLRIYTHVYLTEEPELANSCIELVVSCTKSSLQQLMNADVKQTVAELLIYFNRNPTFVMRSFQSLLQFTGGGTSDRVELSSQAANAEFATFIAERFLGVIAYFESCLSEPSFEKPLKEETLYSLGQIMRFVGAQHVTQFRFKIIAMLSFVHTLNEPRLQRICLKIWHIFLHVVNVQELGPSLGRIVATLQPLLADSESVSQVNDLYEFVILHNASMLGNYITDLYFLERMENVSPAIRKCIRRHTAHLVLSGGAGAEEEDARTQLRDQLRFLHKHIVDECLQVRIYALEHLGELFGRRRPQLNGMILNEQPLEPMLEQIVNVLMAGCQHDDRQLQMASAKCLGELGAIDASYLPSNYNFASSKPMPLSVLSDDFAVLALTALCGGYQFQQQKTKHVDSFSLAIQETLAICGISPKEHKKVQLWQSLPERMRQVMEPLLHSCYTSCQRPSSLLQQQQQPLFGSHYYYEEWAFLWAARLIDYIQSSTDTRHLLNSYKPCIKRDGNMLSTFYPYILLHALLECTREQRRHILEEFMAVLRANEKSSSSAQQELGEIKENAFKQFESRKYGAGARPPPKPADGSFQERNSADSSHVPRLAGKLCAELLDFLQRWLREWQRMNGRSTGGKPPQTIDANYRKIHEFLQEIPKLLVSRASYNCGEYARALSYLESYLEEGEAGENKDKPKRLFEQFTFLVEVYGSLMDSDSVEGAVQARSYDSVSVTQDIVVNRLVERQQDMITCYEQLLSSTDQLQPEHVRAMIDAYLRDTPRTAQLIADGLWQRLSEDQYSEQCFAECKSELLWRLGSYDELEELQLDELRTNWPAQCSQGCLALRRPLTTRPQFDGLLDGMRGSVLEQLRSCSAVQQLSYANAYDSVLKLHLVHELQCSQQLVEQLERGETNPDREEKVMLRYFEDWQYRLQVIQPQVRVQEPIYSFRRNLLAELQHRLSGRAHLLPHLQTELARLWLNSAQINRNAGQLQRAQLYILKAADYKPPGLFIERARLLWQKGDQVMAINYLEEHLSSMHAACRGNTKSLPEDQRHLFFQGKYLQAVYNAESMHLCADVVLRQFEEAIAVDKESESCHVQLAQFLEKMREAKGKSSSHESDEMLNQILFNYARSLRYGSEHVYQSMPRLISLWLDTVESSTSDAQVRKMNDLLSTCCNALPTSVFYTVYSQMLSRLCHPNADAFGVLRNVIVRLVEAYPQQSLWMLLPHFKSATAHRIKRCKLVLTDRRLQNSAFQKLLSDFNSLTERLMELTNKEVALDRTYKLSDLDRRLPRLCNQSDFSKILLPFEKYMQPTLPLSSDAMSTLPGNSTSTSSSSRSNWFPYQQIYISGFQESVSILRSAAKPKKLTIRCSDGQDYDVLVKPKDDLRRDARLMEFNGLVKRYLHQTAAARHRRLHIRTYAVLPFNEECGLVEWLPNLTSYRSICMSLYAQRGQGMPSRLLQQMAVPLHDTLERKREIFVKHLLPAHPPVFQEWLRQRFATLHSWYEARNTYIRTVAVMSMVGYILGLGDRHGENILFDERNGDAVHVDFNCLFNQGQKLAFPEVVPFRLTQNMIAAMGPLGVEGSYRKCCEITLRLLKQEAKTLMSMLRPFVYDVGAQIRNGSAAAKITNDVQMIADRLQGHVTTVKNQEKTNSIPLSTEGQVNFLINEATKLDNLAVMYIGWGAFL